MSGPEYPRAARGEGTGIGFFQVGVTPIGSVPEFDVWETIVSQYANSPQLTNLITTWAVAVDPTSNLDSFYDLIRNLDTAEGYGLDVWGRIVGVNRVLQVANDRFFGFEEAAADTFGQSPLYSGQRLTENFALSDKAYRLLILVKAMANITQDAIPMLNQMLMTLFPNRGNAYVTEGPGDANYFGFKEAINASGFNQAPFYDGETLPRMEMSYTFEFELNPVEMAIVQNSGVLPKPAGVHAITAIIPAGSQNTAPAAPALT